MIFNSLTFAVFLASVLLVARSKLGWGERKGFLLLASYAFYAAWNPPFVVLLFGTSPPSTRLPGPSTGVGNR